MVRVKPDFIASAVGWRSGESRRSWPARCLEGGRAAFSYCVVLTVIIRFLAS